MPRNARINIAGFYHVSNRGVGFREVFLSDEDRVYFISLICHCANQYEFIVHGYALLSNGYNLLIETTKNNLSNSMKCLNGQYTSYFNRKYKRRGHLWEGRYRSWYLSCNVEFVLEILAYIENLPEISGISSNKKFYPYSSYRQFVGIDEMVSCLKKSIVLKSFNSVTQIKDYFNKSIDIDRIERIHKLLSKQSYKSINVDKKRREVDLKPIRFEDFTYIKNISERNSKIYELYKMGYSQAIIGSVFGITQQAVCKILRKFDEK